MYPEGCLLAPDGKIFLSFEKDPLNPLNEGFIEFWSVSIDRSKTFIYKKRLAKNKALFQWNSLITQGWEEFHEYELVA